MDRNRQNKKRHTATTNTKNIVLVTILNNLLITFILTQIHFL